MKIIFFTFIVFIINTGLFTQTSRNTGVIFLKGKWNCELDYRNTGIQEKWFERKFSKTVFLPGTLDENKLGYINKEFTTDHLNRKFNFEGAAWYKKNIFIPRYWEDKYIELYIERTKVSRIWIDSILIDSCDNISTPQIYDLTDKISPGDHEITILVNNDPKLVPVGGSHAYTNETQVNWNGIIGEFYIKAVNKTRMGDVQIYPDLKNCFVLLKLNIQNMNSINKGTLVINVNPEKYKAKNLFKRKKFNVLLDPGLNNLELKYELGRQPKSWSEFSQPLYKMSIILSDEKDRPLDSKMIQFGLRDFATEGTQFKINDRITFLRVKHDGSVFPLTGYTSTNVSEWERIFRIAKSYGINHFRFHSYCPANAAFTAADKVGIYLQPELPFWGSYKSNDSVLIKFMLKEGKNILNQFGNHPSFVMMSLGNELGGDKGTMKNIIDEFRKYDNRHLFAQGSNNYFWDPFLQEGDDYWTTARTGKEKENMGTDVRGSFAFVDSKTGGIINSCYPSTKRTYEDAINNVPKPVIGHEIGQFQIFPDFSEIKKYREILKPYNFIEFKKRLEKAGMADQAGKFVKASGALSALCYKEEIELALRTKGFGGFQLLDLQDYPGQGTALVGILNAFMESKNVISKNNWTKFCNRVVPLLLINKYCWTNNETFEGLLRIANYSEKDLNDKIVWTIEDQKEKSVIEGNFNAKIKQGEFSDVGKIRLDLSQFKKAVKLAIKIKTLKTNYHNDYSIWVYPKYDNDYKTGKIIASEILDEITIEKLLKGGNVFLTPKFSSIKENSVGGLFITDFWNYKMFKRISESNKKDVSPGTLGILTDPSHPVFKNFPTDFHTNWQWWTIIKNSHPIILDNTSKKYRPIVQVIDNVERNHKLGLIFEFKTGRGKLLICSSDLNNNPEKPEVRQLKISIINYMTSKYFDPKYEISIDELKKIFR